MDIAARSLKVKRTVITKLLDEGLYPYTKRYLGTFGNHFSTIGLIGMNEAGLNAKWLRRDLTHPETQRFAKEVLNHMRERLSDYQEQYGDLYNLEATPAESTTYRFAKHDVEQFPDIITANENGTPYYTNSSHLPVGYTEDLFEALDIQDGLQTLYTSGTVFHAFLGEKLPDWKAAANLVRKIAENYTLPLLHALPHLFRLSGSRLSGRRAIHLSPLRPQRRRYTAVSQDTTVRYRTGTTAKLRNSRTARYTMSKPPVLPRHPAPRRTPLLFRPPLRLWSPPRLRRENGCSYHQNLSQLQSRRSDAGKVASPSKRRTPRRTGTWPGCMRSVRPPHWWY